MAKKSSKKTSKKAAPPSSLRINLTRALQAQANNCLERSGKISLSMKPVSVTRLPKTLAPNLLFID